MDSNEVLEQICQIKEKYESQVTGNHKQWPRAIKDRVIAVYRSGISLRAISSHTGISYHTLSSWTAKAASGKFKELSVRRSLSIPRNTNPSIATAATNRNSSVTITCSGGYTIEGLTLDDVVTFFRKIGGS